MLVNPLSDDKILDWSKNKLQTTFRVPAVDRQWRQMRKFLTNGSKIEALVNLLATNNIYKRFLKDLKLHNKRVSSRMDARAIV